MEGQSNNSCYVEVPPIAKIYIKMQAIVSHISGYYINLKSSPLLPSLFSLSSSSATLHSPHSHSFRFPFLFPFFSIPPLISPPLFSFSSVSFH